MKKANRILTLLLAVMMVFSLACTIFAAEGDETKPGSITIDNPIEDTTYTAYKIFDVIYNDDQTAYDYTINAKSEWYNDVAAYADDEETDHGIELKPSANNADTVVVTLKGGSFSAADFAAYLSSKTTDKNGTPLTINQNAEGKVISASVNDLALGYYLVAGTYEDNSITNSPALANLTTTNPDATIYDKNDVPFDKVANDKSVEVGQEVKFTITGKVPDYTGFTRYDYVVSDKMSKGLRFNRDSVVVKIGDNVVSPLNTTETMPVAGAANYAPANEIWYGTGDERDFVIGLNLMEKDADGKYVYAIGQDIEITYTATVTKDAVVVISKNDAKLDYSNDPSDSTKTGTRTDEEKLYSAKIVVDKFVKDKPDEKLAGAEFVLYKNEEVTVDGSVGEDGSTNEPVKKVITKYYKYTPATGTTDAKVDWVENIANATVVTTDKDGFAEFIGLEDGTYYLLETKAPAGYNLATDAKQVVIEKEKGEEALKPEATDVTVLLTTTERVPNSTGPELPGTGGIGTTIFYIVGSVLVAGAVVVLIAKKRMGAEK